jgi:hypothetical protein
MVERRICGFRLRWIHVKAHRRRGGNCSAGPR